MSTRRLRALPFLLAALPAWVPALPSHGGGAVRLRLRDAATGAFLEGRATAGRDPAGTAVGPAGTFLELPGGGVAVKLEAPGHRPMETRLVPAGPSPLEVTAWMDPVRPGPPWPRSAPGASVVEGWVYDAARGRPVALAVIRVVETGAEAVSGEDGRFELLGPVPPDRTDSVLPAEGTLTVEVGGYRTLVVEHVELGGVVRTILDLEPGEGLVETVRRHRHLAPGEDQLGPSRPGTAPAERTGLPSPLLLTPMDPPASIRVGTSCSCTSCSSVSVMSLETYVARGLDNEWISSWDGDSLRAGSIAYRSYGAWYVLHPLSSSYDICSTPCCQAYGSTQYAAVAAAANATAGFMLQRGGDLFRAEYSAEDNAWDDPDDGLSCTNDDLSCGDGRAGSPAAGWPCLDDAVCSGHGCFGHGRGMCQWGTQRWAATMGRSWPWIVDHYYNDNGTGTGSRTATMTSPLDIGSAAPNPATLAPGGSFEIGLDLHNGAELDHPDILIGASLYAPGVGSIDDPAHDQPVTVPSGESTASRLFEVPAGTPDGSYDLLTALYYDVDGDGAIGSADLALVLRTDPGAVAVSSLPVLSGQPASLPEGNRSASTLTVTLSLDPPAGGDVSVDWSTRAGSAASGLDFVPASGRAVIPAGEAATTVEVTVLGDYLVEGDEELFVDLSNPSGATLAGSSLACTILDDDTSPCDADLSGTEDAEDLATMLRVLSDPTYEPAGNPDCTQDGVLDGADVRAVTALIFG